MSCCPTCNQPVPSHGLLVSLDTNEAARNGVFVELKPLEAEVLYMLAVSAPGTVSDALLLDGMYGPGGGPKEELNVLRQTICHLRKKLNALDVRIETINKQGYRLNVSGHLNA